MNVSFIIRSAMLLLVAMSTNAILAQSDLSIKTHVTLRSGSVEVLRPLVAIGDIATVRSSNLAVSNAIKKLDVELIEDKKSVMITQSQILMRIRLAGLPYENIRMSGPTAIQVKHSTVVETELPIKTSIVAAIAKQFGIPKEDIRVSVNSNAKSNPLVSELVQVIDSAMIVLPTRLPLGANKVRFLFQNQEGLDRSLEVNCRVTVMKEMLLANKFIPRGAFVELTDFNVVKRPLEDARLQPASSKQITGKRSRNDISQFDVLEIQDLEFANAKNIVRRNDFVDVVIVRNGVKLRLKNAKVLTPGGKGDQVEILNPQSQRKIVASVVDSSMVEVR